MKILPTTRKSKSLVLFLFLSIFCLVFYYYSTNSNFIGTEFQPAWVSFGINESLQYVKPHQETVLFSYNLSSSLNHDNQPNLALLFVMSLPQAFNKRSEIRETWANVQWQNNYNIKVIFFLGKPPDENIFKLVEAESTQFQDMVVDNFEENYYKLPIKVLRVMKFYLKIQKNSPQILPYFIKCDDDVFVNLPLLATYLISRQSNKFFIGGNVYMFPQPVRNLGSKFYTPTSFWKGPLYPSHLSGVFYIINGNLISRIYQTGLTSPFVPFEDVLITGIVANRALGLDLINTKEKVIDWWGNGYKIVGDLKKLRKTLAITPVRDPHSFRTLFQRLQLL